MPSPAPDFETLYDFETQVEDAFEAILKANGIPNVFTSRAPDTITTPAVVLRFVTGQVASQRALRGNPPRLVPNGFEGTLIAEILTGRRLADAPVHGPFRGKVRYLLSAAANVIDQTNTPWIQILDFLPAGGTPQITDEKEIDRSALHFAMKFAIRNEAWPSP
jgi:hypothetical protein